MRDAFDNPETETAKAVNAPESVRMDVVRLDSFLSALQKAAEAQERKVIAFPERRSDKD